MDLTLLDATVARIVGEVPPSFHDVENDVADEQELQSPENWHHIRELDEQVEGLVTNEDLAAVIEENSREVADGTDKSYRRLMASFDAFLRAQNFIARDQSIFNTATLPARTPMMIVAWIMKSCDEVNPDGTKKLHGQHCSTYSSAMKMRSSATYGFGRLYARGNLSWQSVDGIEYRGNPSCSTEVSRYMLALRRRKYTSGETPMGSRAISADIIQRMYQFNNQPEQLAPVPIQQTSRDSRAKVSHDWGGPRARLLVHAITVLSFICLLRSDEIVNLRVEDLNLISTECISISLPSRKTSQFGGDKPFVLWRLDDEDQHLCPILALAKWVEAANIESGYLFRGVNSTDSVSTDATTHLTSSAFLELFRHNLVDVGQDPSAYGTHSLRRGGCQWLAKDRRWTIPQICDWGGWSRDFTHLTIVRYLINWNDDLSAAREDFFNPNRPPNVRCHRCGRSCWHG